MNKNFRNREAIASEYYDKLKDFLSKPQYSSLRELLPPKEEFIKNYPLSTLGIVTPRRFWEECLHVGIIEHHFWDDDELFTPFEKELHYFCESNMYCPEEYTQSDFKRDVENLFRKYRILI